MNSSPSDQRTLKRLIAYFDGRVQGVGFRYSTVYIAGSYAVTGSVKNLSDGRVEVIVEGEEEELKKFLDMLCSGPLKKFIRQCLPTWAPYQGTFRSFSIAY